MEIGVFKGLFVAASKYHEREITKQAGFLWHDKKSKCLPTCKACEAGITKVWWTAKPAVAALLAPHANEAALAAMADHLAAVKLSKAADAEIAIPVPDGLSYRPYQRAGIAYADSHKNVLFGDEMGLGKTIQALGVINLDASIKNVLIVCPASLRINWHREALKWLVRPFSYHIIETNEAPPPDANFVIVNYNRLVGDVGSQVLPALMAREWDFLVVDEAHYLKNPKAQRTTAVLGVLPKRVRNVKTGEWQVKDPGSPGLVNRATRRVFLTGTPLPNRIMEAHPLLAVLAPTEFANKFGFGLRYCNGHKVVVRKRIKKPDGTKDFVETTKWSFKGSSHLEELQERMRAACMVRRLKAQVEKELPPKDRLVICIPPGKASVAVQKEIETYNLFETQKAALQAEAALAHAAGNMAAYEEAAEKLRYLDKVSFYEMSRVRHETAVAKIPYLIEHLDRMLAEGVAKVVFFAHHKDVLNAVADHFGKSATILTGDTPMKRRQENVDRFQKDPTCKVFVGSIQAAGVGLTLTAASNVVFGELDWVPGNMSQAEDRCHRIGQCCHVFVQHVVFDGSLDAKMAHTLVEKQRVADKALDNDTCLGALQTEDDSDQSYSPFAKSAYLPPPKVYPAVTGEIKAWAKQAIQYLASLCDGAVVLDGAGFNKVDTTIGKALAGVSGVYTDGQAFVARKLARKYRKQLPAELRKILELDK